MSRELFIYWKCSRALAEQAEAAVVQLQDRLRAAHPGLQARLYRRAPEPGEDTTLMETYAQPGGVDAALQTAIEADAAAALAPWRLGPRHVEVFDALPS